MEKIISEVKITDISQEEAAAQIKSWLETAERGKVANIVTPQTLDLAKKDAELKNVLNSFALNLPSGFGLSFLSGIKNKIAGRALVLSVGETLAKTGLTMGFFGGENGEPGKIKGELEKSYPGIKISWTVDGEEAGKIFDKQWAGNYTVPDVDVLVVALEPKKQENFIGGAKNYKVAIGVGKSL